MRTTSRTPRFSATLPVVFLLTVVVWVPISAQSTGTSGSIPRRLADGQPDIQGMWNNEDANHTPLELPDELAGRSSFTPEDLQARAEARAKRRIEAGDSAWTGDPGSMRCIGSTGTGESRWLAIGRRS